MLLLSVRGGRDLAKIDRRAVGFALFTALTICAYSVVDGIGARARRQRRTPIRSWLFVGIALVMVPYALLPRRPRCHAGDAAVSGGAGLAAAPCR